MVSLAVTSSLICSGPHGRFHRFLAAFARDGVRSAARDDGRRHDRRRAARLGVRLLGDRPADRRDRRHPARGLRGLQGLRRQPEVSTGAFSTPRPIPGRLVPALAGTGVIVLALPVFAVAGWPLSGWLFAAVLWIAAQSFAWLLTRLSLDAGNLAAAGMRGIGTSFKAIAVGIPLVAVTVSDERVGVAAALLYAFAFTVELAVSLVTYFGAEAKA